MDVIALDGCLKAAGSARLLWGLCLRPQSTCYCSITGPSSRLPKHRRHRKRKFCLVDPKCWWNIPTRTYHCRSCKSGSPSEITYLPLSDIFASIASVKGINTSRWVELRTADSNNLFQHWLNMTQPNTELKTPLYSTMQHISTEKSRQ